MIEVLTGKQLTESLSSRVETERGILWRMEKAEGLIADGYREGWALMEEALDDLERYLATCPEDGAAP